MVGGSFVIKLQSSLDLCDHFVVLSVGQLLQTGVHCEGGAPLILILVLGNQVEVQVAAAVAVSAVVDLIGVECLVDGVGSGALIMPCGWGLLCMLSYTASLKALASISRFSFAISFSPFHKFYNCSNQHRNP